MDIRKQIDIGGRHLYVECNGEGGPTVLLESGLGDGCDSWEPIWTQLTAMTTVCRYDRAGVGKSDPAQRPRSSREVVADLHSLLNKLGLARPLVIVAHSFGCLHARLFAHQCPEKVAALVFLDSTLPDLGEKLLPFLPPPTAQDSEALQSFRATQEDPKITEEVEGLVANACFAQVQAYRSLGDIPLVHLNSGSLVFDPGASWWPPDLPAELAEAFTQSFSESKLALINLSSKGREVFVQGSGHYIHHDKPEVVIDIVRQVINEIG
ncbi:MAG: alpha/beta hydrolase [Caldilineaceae bacterium]